jgi:hypothetical protein
MTDEIPAVILTRAIAAPGRPGKVTFGLRNLFKAPVEVVSGAFEVKRSYLGSRHSLPRPGWGYAVTTAVAPKTVLPPGRELWTTFELDRRTTFGGLISPKVPPPDAPHFYLAGLLLYRRCRGELFETGFYKRLIYPGLTFDAIDPSDTGLNHVGRVVFFRASLTGTDNAQS